MSLTTNTPFLRRALLADAAISGLTGLAMVELASTLDSRLGLPSALLFWAGLSFLPYAAALVFLATRDMLPRWTVRTVIAFNAIWAVDCVLFLLSGAAEPNRLGVAFVLAQAAAVAIFAEWQVLALRRAPQLTPRYA